MNKVNFLFGIHDHQPVGNFNHVFEQSFDKSYYPFLDLLEGFPKVKTTMHFSGILLKWIEENRPKGIDILKRMVERGQLEMMTGGFYEPILPVIPDRDKKGQIRKLTDYITHIIGDRPTGMWLAERVWEPHLPRVMRESGVRYTVLDDAHFKYSGLTDDQLYGYYTTEDEGETIALFPISRKLRYTIPFRPIDETLEYLRNLSTEEGKLLAIYADDGEKFGVWPGTYKTCFTEKWLERFFKAISDNTDWINILHFRDALDQLDASGRVYLPTASYTEMNEWALPARAVKKFEEFNEKLQRENLYEEYGVFVRGGFWRNFLAKYPETNNMHKKMLMVSNKIADLRSESKASAVDLDITTAEDYLWRGQCNCPYWHGVFGGMYLTHVRSAIYQNLIMAEKILDRSTRNRPDWTDVSVFDFDRDSRDDLVVESSNLNLYFKPSAGASAFEIDYKPANLNVVDTVTRREEGYHHKISSSRTGKVDEGESKSIHDIYASKEAGLDKLLSYDWYRRGCFIDHFFGEGVVPETFITARYPEEGDFVNQSYDFDHKLVGPDRVVTFSREGGVWYQGKHARVHIEKEFVIEAAKPAIELVYKITNRDKFPVTLNFGSELNFGFPNLTSPNVNYTIGGEVPSRFKRLDSTSAATKVKEFGIRNDDDNFILDFLIQKEADLWRMPVYSVSLSEEGFEKVQQGICIVPSWKMYLAPKESWELKIIMKFREIDPAKKKNFEKISLARA